MSKLLLIDEILSPKYKVGNQRELVETDLDSKGKKFSLTYGIVKQSSISHLLYRYDHEAFPFFNDVTDLKKMCDYILFAEEGKFLYAFVIELKKGGESAKKQLLAAKEYVHFIIASAKRIGKTIDENIIIRMIRVSEERIQKFKKRSQKEEDALDYIDGYCDYPFKVIYLERLMQF